MFEDYDDNLLSENEIVEYDSKKEGHDVGLGLQESKNSNICIGHQDKEEILLGWINNNILPHALIFTGPVGIGKSTFAYRLARALLKKSEEDGQNNFFSDTASSLLSTLDISQDDPVFTKVASGAHPDFLWLEYSLDPKKEGKKADIDVYTARKVAPFLRMTATDGGWRIVIIDNADTMNRNAQNAVLKILEEPPKKSLLILVAHRLGAMIPTIRSRCRVLQFHEIKEEYFQELLDIEMKSHFSELDRNILFFLGRGSIGVVKNIIDTGSLDIVKNILNIFESWPQYDWVSIHQLADLFSKTTGGEEAFSIFSYSINCIFEDMVRIKATGNEQNVSVPISKEVKDRFLEQYSLEELSEICEKIREYLKQADVSKLDKYQAVLGCFAILAAGD